MPEATREAVTALGSGFYNVVLRFGFMEEVDVPRALADLAERNAERNAKRNASRSDEAKDEAGSDSAETFSKTAGEVAAAEGILFDPSRATYFLGRETLRPGSLSAFSRALAMPGWRENLFALLYRNSRHAADYFRLPPDQVVELGVQLELSA